MAGQASMTYLQACSPPKRRVIAGFQKTNTWPELHLAIEGRTQSYWMHVAVPLTAPLSKLDDFLRHTWLECCGT